MSVAMSVVVGSEQLARPSIRFPYKREMVTFTATGDASGGTVSGTHIFRNTGEPISSDLVALERHSFYCSNSNRRLSANYFDFDFVRGAPAFSSYQGMRFSVGHGASTGFTVSLLDEMQPKLYIGRMTRRAANTPACVWQWETNTNTETYWNLIFHLYWDQAAITEGGMLWPGDFEG